MDPRSSLPPRTGGHAGFRSLGLLASLTVIGPVAGMVVLGATVSDWLPLLEEAGAPGIFACGVLVAAFSLVPTHVVALVCGYLLGALDGALMAVVTVTVASGLGFAWLRAAAGARLFDAIERRPRARRVHAALVRAHPLRAVGLLALLRLSPLMPFAATNLLMAAIRMTLTVFLIGSLIGLAPRVVVVAVAGAGLATLDPMAWNERPGLLVVGGVATLAALLSIGWIGRRALDGAVRPLD